MNKAVCVDASFVVALLAVERFTEACTRHWKAWIEEDVRILAPALAGYEITSALYRKAFRKIIDSESHQAALRQFLALDIESIHLPILHIRASDLAARFNRPNTYDAHYLALAEYYNCPLWTADEKLYNSVKDQFEWIKWVEEVES